MVVNTGTAYQGGRHRERFEQALGRPLDVRAIVFTQSHQRGAGGELLERHMLGGQVDGLDPLEHIAL